MFKIFSRKNDKKNSVNSNSFGDGRAILNAVADGIITIDPSGNIAMMNPAAERIIGWSNGDALGLDFASVLHLVDKNGAHFTDVANPISRALQDFKSFKSSEISVKTDSGKNIPLSIDIDPIDDKKSGLVVIFRNISKEMKKNREEAEFISTASHEMRTPVASIEGYLGLAMNPATATVDARALAFLQKAHENVRHLGQLFQDLLDITRAEDGRLKNEPVVLDATEIARDIWQGLHTRAGEKNLNYIFEPDEKKTSEKVLAPVYFINVDRDHLREILNNLIENAIKYTPEGKVSVNVSGDNENVWISVADSGIGIPAEDIPHLFQKFYRVDNSETREIGGTGLGLYLSRRLAEILGGSLTLKSEYKSGSVFTLNLPRIPRRQAEKLLAQEKIEVPKPKAESVKIPEIISQNQADYEIYPSPEQTTPATTLQNYPIQAQQAPVQDPQPAQPAPAPNPQPAQTYRPQSFQYNYNQPTQLQSTPQPASAPPQQNLNIPPAQTQSRPPTLSEIEQMREEYVKRMMKKA